MSENTTNYHIGRKSLTPNMYTYYVLPTMHSVIVQLIRCLPRPSFGLSPGTTGLPESAQYAHVIRNIPHTSPSHVRLRLHEDIDSQMHPKQISDIGSNFCCGCSSGNNCWGSEINKNMIKDNLRHHLDWSYNMLNYY